MRLEGCALDGVDLTSGEAVTFMQVVPFVRELVM